MNAWLALLLLPLVAALHRYAVNYGYRGFSRRLAFEDALRVGLTAGLVVGGLLLTSCSSDASRTQGRAPVAPMSRAAERQHVLDQGREFCARYPDDIVCPGRR